MDIFHFRTTEDRHHTSNPDLIAHRRQVQLPTYPFSIQAGGNKPIPPASKHELLS